MDYQDQYTFQGFVNQYEITISLTPYQLTFFILDPIAKLTFRARLPNKYEGKSKQIQDLYINLEQFYKYIVDYAEDKERVSIDKNGTIKIVKNQLARRSKNAPTVFIPTTKVPYFEPDNQKSDKEQLQRQIKINQELQDRLVRVMFQRKQCWQELSLIKKILNLPEILQNQVKQQYNQIQSQNSIIIEQIFNEDKIQKNQQQKSHVSIGEISQNSFHTQKSIMSNNLSIQYLSSGLSLDTPFKYLTSQQIVQNLQILTEQIKTQKEQKKDDDILMQKTKTIQKLRRLSKIPKSLPKQQKKQ